MKVLNKLKSFFNILKNEIKNLRIVLKCFFYSIFRNNKVIIVQAWVKQINGKIVKQNWGDDINVFFIEKLSHKKVYILPQTFLAKILPMHTYVLVGSCIEYAHKKNSVVWGSGLMNDKEEYPLPHTKSKILAVRGPLTYNWLVKKNIACNKIFGDPALLLPKFYKKSLKKIYDISYIPHHSEHNVFNHGVIDIMNREGIHIIDIVNYEKWTDFIDEICRSDFVLSSSLHGLIISEAYNIPSKWVISPNQLDGFDFKFHDFYQSIGKIETPIKIISSFKKVDVIEYKKKWVKGVIDTDELLSVCPFLPFKNSK